MYHSVEGDETGITVSISVDNADATVAIMKTTGKDGSDPNWMSAKENIKTVSDSFRDFLDGWGAAGVPLTFNLVSDTDYNKILISFVDSELVYDILAK